MLCPQVCRLIWFEKSGAPSEVSHMKLSNDNLMLKKLQRFLQGASVVQLEWSRFAPGDRSRGAVVLSRADRADTH